MTKNPAQKRRHTRSRVWADINAFISVEDPFNSAAGRNVLKVRGKVEDLGSSGMFLKTGDSVPVPAKVEIVIDFDMKRPGTLCLRAVGETVRRTPEGVGIRFTDINLRHLQRCIMTRMNRGEKQD